MEGCSTKLNHSNLANDSYNGQVKKTATLLPNIYQIVKDIARTMQIYGTLGLDSYNLEWLTFLA